jgi:transposase
MGGSDKRPGELFSYVDLEQRVRPDHPVRAIRALTDSALAALSRDFAALYSGLGRPSIAPETLLRAMLLQAFYSVRSERQLMERLEFDLLFRWFVGLGIDDAVWDHSTFSKNRDRLLEGEIAARFLTAVLAQPRIKRLLSTEHFSVDGTLIEAWASMKSFRPKEPPAGGDGGGGGRNAPADFRGEKRSNQTHQSTTDPDARAVLQGARPGGEAVLYRPWVDGEPLRPDRRCPAHARLGPCRAVGGARYDRRFCRSPARRHARRRQGLRIRRLR